MVGYEWLVVGCESKVCGVTNVVRCRCKVIGCEWWWWGGGGGHRNLYQLFI